MKDLRKLENLNKFAEMFGIESEYPAGHPKRNCDSCAWELQNISCKTFPRKNNFA